MPAAPASPLLVLAGLAIGATCQVDRLVVAGGAPTSTSGSGCSVRHIRTPAWLNTLVVQTRLPRLCAALVVSALSAAPCFRRVRAGGRTSVAPPVEVPAGRPGCWRPFLLLRPSSYGLSDADLRRDLYGAKPLNDLSVHSARSHRLVGAGARRHCAAWPAFTGPRGRCGWEPRAGAPTAARRMVSPQFAGRPARGVAARLGRHHGGCCTAGLPKTRRRYKRRLTDLTEFASNPGHVRRPASVPGWR